MGKQRNNNKDYHDFCVKVIYNYINFGLGKIFGFDMNSRSASIVLDTCIIREKDLFIDESERNFKCDIFARCGDKRIYIEVVNTNRDILKFDDPTEKLQEYIDRGCYLVVIDVRDLIIAADYEWDAIEGKLLKSITSVDKSGIVWLRDYSNNLPVIEAGGFSFKGYTYDDKVNHVVVTSQNGDVIAFAKTNNGFANAPIAKRYKDKLIVAKKYDSKVDFIENLRRNNIF